MSGISTVKINGYPNAPTIEVLVFVKFYRNSHDSENNILWYTSAIGG